MGMVLDILSCFLCKFLFGYKLMVYFIFGIVGLGFVVWGYYMFIFGMDLVLGMIFMVVIIMIVLLSVVKVFNWLGILWGVKIEYMIVMLYVILFVLMFIIGGLSGIFMVVIFVDIFIYDIYFIVVYFYYVFFVGMMMVVFGVIYFWYLKMFGCKMNEFWGKVYFFLIFVFFNGIFFMMYILGVVGFFCCYVDFYYFEIFEYLLFMN